jgi:hypothetical protein
VNYAHFSKYWLSVTKADSVESLNDITRSIVIEGYPMDYVLKFFKDKVIDSALPDVDKSEIVLFIANVERMLSNGAGNHIQTLAIITLIVSKIKHLKIRVPEIF